jgi:hypothetical protein
MKSNYEERKAARIERYRKLAEKNETASEHQFNSASEMAKVIPFGQPILVGHHSEKRDRNYRGKINRLQDKAMESSSKAKYYEERAAIAESNTAISSDDPQALTKLREKLDAMMELQELMKAANKIIRNKKLSDDEKVQKLTEHNIKESHARKLLLPDFAGRIGFPQYRLTNNNQNMARVKERILKLEKLGKMESKEEVINGIRIYTNVEENRLQVFFPNKPDEITRKALKGNGFRWSPTEGAWQRQISTSAEYLAKQIASNVVQTIDIEST